MKNTLYRTKIGLAFVTASLLTMVSCTGDFEHFNTDPNSAQQIDPTTLITSMELDAMYPTTGETTVPVNNYQTGWNLLADHYAGYMACANHWEGGINPLVYNLTNNWRSTVFSVAFTQVMPAWLQLKAAYDQGLVAGEVMAICMVLCLCFISGRLARLMMLKMYFTTIFSRRSIIRFPFWKIFLLQRPTAKRW